MMELILLKRSQKVDKLKKDLTKLSRLSKLKLLPDDLYKTITQKSRSYREEDRNNKRQQYSQRSADGKSIKCTLSMSSSSSSLESIASISVSSQSTGEMSDESVSIDVSDDDEIPIWVHGEQRWISGITNETTCAQLVEALLRNENITGEPASMTVTKSTENQYAITERWRRVEQMLDNKTKILKIWKAWGQTKSEVQFSLRRIDYVRSRSHHGEYDSGRESPVPRAGSAIVRRRRHRSAKTWSKNVKTIHPKSSRASIEQLMKLILEQGETIQQQLSKLRDRENEIASFENEHRTHRRHVENRMGKNYLLETYLNGLLEVYADSGENTEDGGEQSANNNNANGIDEIDKVITTPGNSDSGVNTEDIATSPEVCLSSQLTNGSSTSSADNNNDGKRTCITAKLMDTKSLKDICKRLTTKKGKKEKNQSTSREEKLIDEHKSRKEFCEKMEKINKDNANENARKPLNEHLAGQIELLEKVIAINKHIQREEELLVRLNAKIRKYEFDDPNLTETEMRRALEQINTNIETSNSELVKTEQELNASDQMLMTKSKIVKELSCELEALEIDIHTNQNLIQVPSHQIQIHSTNTEESHDIQQNQIEQFQHHHKNPHQIQQQSHVPSTHQTNETNQMPIAILSSNSNNSMKTGTLPKLISSVFKKNTPINSGTIPKTHHRNMCNQIPSPNIERTTNTTSIPSNNTAIYIANQSFHLPDHVILSQAPLFFQKDTFNGNFMQSTDQRNINNNKNKSPTTITNNTNYSNHTISNLTDNNSINLNNMNINPSMPSCEKVGTKKLINGFYKDPDTGNPGLSLLGEDGLLQNIGTLV